MNLMKRLLLRFGGANLSYQESPASEKFVKGENARRSIDARLKALEVQLDVIRRQSARRG